VRAPGNVVGAGRLYGATPRLVASGFSRVSHGRDHACALANDGTVWCWGSNASGKLGRGTFGGPESSIPAQVQGLSGVQVVVAARTHTCALKLDKTVVCWGGNFDGQLGIGLSGGGNDRNVPTVVPGLTDVVTISANAHHTCATKTDKSVWCWGGNASSQLGVGDAVDRTVPTRLSGFSAEVAVAGSTFSLARSGGAIFTFGSNTNSELGRGAVGTSPTPAPIVGLDQVTFADAGYSHACVVRQGAIVCWGDNGSGQLGLGDKANRAVPVTVTLP
jgi:alpha-tubulin suppressor-like RCC1 family protein